MKIYNKRKRVLAAFVLGLILSGVFLYFALRDVDWVQLGSTLLNVRQSSMGFCMLMIASGILLRSWRWRLVSQAQNENFVAFAKSTNLGILSNQLLPGRVGEIIRVISLVRLTSLGLARGLGGAVIDRALDVVSLLVIAWGLSLLVATVAFPGTLFWGLVGILILVVLGHFIARTRLLRTLLSAWSERWIHRWALRAEDFFTLFYSLIRELVRPRTVFRLALLAVLIAMADYLAVAFAVWSVGAEVPLYVPMVLWVLLSFGSTLPSAPGYLGIYQLVAVWALAPYGVSAHQAVAVAFVLQAATLLVSLLGVLNDIRILIIRKAYIRDAL
ncbi:MAG: lysylphosphatidylglycerol synthase transmembrane domain-containing protein [Candidatus Gottesmanbacteria bacterium]|nr:lysylphosphatidylglycerol synthase transmembrane domain-containing protein [Candidatus Gottesmanbacteria bacterium]